MRATATAVLERKAEITDGFSTEPYELPWAGEARFFVQAFEIVGTLELRTQISPDGLHWCDLERAQVARLSGPGLISWSVDGFGQWLRLRATAAPDATASARIYLVGKS